MRLDDYWRLVRYWRRHPPLQMMAQAYFRFQARDEPAAPDGAAGQIPIDALKAALFGRG